VIPNRTLFAHDCLDVLSDTNAFPDKCIDLIYLDPPFNSKAIYNLPFPMKYKQQEDFKPVMAFNDTWSWNDECIQQLRRLELGKGEDRTLAELVKLTRSIRNEKTYTKDSMSAYLISMAVRLKQMRRVLKTTGSIYLHCDPTASHYLKMLMDTIFGAGNFRNEIIWKRRQEKHNLPDKTMGKIHEVIFWYGDLNLSEYRKQYQPYDEKYLESHYQKRDSRGQYETFPLTNEKGGNRVYSFKGVSRAWKWSEDRMNEMFDKDMLVQLTKDGPFRYKKYLEDAQGVPLQDLWTDIDAVRGKQSLGYPTQKPIELMSRIIKASSDEGDVILDPFCGCGTTVHAAEELGRCWVGIDISQFSNGLIRNRLCDNFPFLSKSDIEIRGNPLTISEAQSLALRDAFEFEKWVCGEIGAEGMYHTPGERGGDGGVDGIIPFYHTSENKKTEQAYSIVQVKGGKVTPDSVRALAAVIKQHKDHGFNSVCGVFVCFEKFMQTVENNRDRSKVKDYFMNRSFDFIQAISVEDLLKGKQPYFPGYRKKAA